MSKVTDYKNAKRQATEVRVVKADKGPGFITHTSYESGEGTGKNSDYPSIGKPETQVHSSLNSVHAHMKDCMSSI